MTNVNAVLNAITIITKPPITVTVTENQVTVNIKAGVAVNITRPNIVINIGGIGPAGAAGNNGTNGTNGTNGVGVPTGGTTNQVLVKTSNTDFVTGWTTAILAGMANAWLAGIQLFKSGSCVQTEMYDNGNVTGTKIILWNNGSLQKATLTGNTTFTFTAPTNTGRFQIIFYGAFTISLPSIKWVGGSAPSFTGGLNMLSVIWDGTQYIGMGGPAS